MDRAKFNLVFFVVLVTIALFSIPIPESVSAKYLLVISISIMVLVLPQIGILFSKIKEKESDK